MKPVIGTVTIGQSPRTDLIPEFKAILGEDVQIIEAGALDGMTLEEVLAIRPEPGDYVLVTKMTDGTTVKIAERHILTRMQKQINGLLEKGVDLVALVCTGEFPPFESERLIVRPQAVLFNNAMAVGQGLRIGVLTPDKDQIPQSNARWSEATSTLRVESASPYGDVSEVVRAARVLGDWGAQLVVMDCIGYTLAMKEMVKEQVRCPVILARSMVARVLAELV